MLFPSDSSDPLMYSLNRTVNLRQLLGCKVGNTGSRFIHLWKASCFGYHHHNRLHSIGKRFVQFVITFIYLLFVAPFTVDVDVVTS